MGTRGLFGIRKNGHDKAVYKQYDSYPAGLGKDFLMFVKLNRDFLDEFYDHIIEVDKNTFPTPEQKEYCIRMGWYDGSVSRRSDNDWYCLLRELQNMSAWQRALDLGQDIYLINEIGFIRDSLFCEYAYIYDLDTGMFEFYKGFQKEPDLTNRYGTEADGDYYPCRLAYSVSMDENINITAVIDKCER